MNGVLDFLCKLSIFDESSQICPKYQKGSLLNIKKKYCNSFCVLLWCKTLRYFTGFQSCLSLLIFGWLWSKTHDHGTLKKSAVFQESELIKWTDFFACWYKFRKANVNLVIIGWAWSKMGKTFRSYMGI